MKTHQASNASEKPTEPASEADRFRGFVKQVMSVPKSEIDKREVEYQAQRATKKKKSRSKA